MRRVLLLAFCALLVAPGVAAAKVEKKKVDRSPAEVSAYWTVERMKNAKPVEHARPVANAKRPPSGGSFVSAQANPYDSAAGKLFFTDDGVNYVCSGTAIVRDVIWTAGHCVHDGAGGTYHDNWLFVPAYNSGAEPYGRFAATTALTTSGWRAGRFGDDLGALKVSGLDAAVAERTLDTSGVKSGAFTSYGYPAGRPFTGQLQWTCAATVSRLDTNQTPPTMALPCDMTGGSSGGGWYGAGGRVYSVNSYGYKTVATTMYGPVQTSNVAGALYTSAQAG